jgi:DNA-binding protein YbaB
MNEAQMQAMINQAKQVNVHLMSTNQRLKMHHITESRGPATVTVNGLGEIQDIQIDGVASEAIDCVIAALRACEEHAKAGYEAFVGGRR